MEMEINLISDTITRPTKAMLEYMMHAKVGDDVFNADPTVIELQDKIAGMFGMEAALFFPSGTMANQTAIKLHTNPGEQIICDKWAHVYNYEGGGASFNSGVSCRLLDGDRGMFRSDQVAAAINDPKNIHLAKTAMVAVENTTNKGGGAIWDFSELKKIGALCRNHDLSFHLDGARLFNALVETGESPKQFGELFDTISICLSKGLGAPIGSVLLSSSANIDKALRIRKLLGGAMRQVGYLAAAGIYALNHHIDRLKEDHRRAKSLAKALQRSPLVTKVEEVESNIVIFNLKKEVSEEDFLAEMEKRKILMISMGEGKLRMVTHLEFTEDMLDKVINEIENLRIAS